MTTFFISDTHFDHKNIIRLENRPFDTVEQMNAVLKNNWNSRVKNNKDLVFFLGDFAWANSDKHFAQLNGRKILIRGNHDYNSENLPWDEKFDQITDLKIDGKRIHLYHYPIEEWDGFHRGSLHFHGHIHDKSLPPKKGRYNLSCEKIYYTPVTLEEILREESF